MQQIIKACEALDLNIIKIQYNDFDDDSTNFKANIPANNALAPTVTKLAIEGMTCAACVSTIEISVKALPGVDRVVVSLPLSKATVVHDPKSTSVEDVVSVIEKTGYGAREGERTAQQNLEIAQHAEELQQLKRAFSNAATLASVIVGIDWFARLSYLSPYHGVLAATSDSLGIWVQLVEAFWIHQRAWSHGLRSPLTMNTLISLSLICGLALSFFNIMLHGMQASNQYFSSGSFLTLVVIGGRYLDTLFRRQTSASLAELYRLQSEMTLVQLRKGGGEKQARVPAVVLRVRDEIIVDAGSIVPCDCYVLEGTTIVDQSTMTGESLAITKHAGDFLMSGTRNLSNEIVAVVAREQGESSLEQLVSSISGATESSKDESNNSAELVSSHFVRGVLVLALIGFVWTYSSSDGSPVPTRIKLACERAMAVLASACPCALGLATPSAVMTGLSAAWAKGAILTGGLRTMQKLTNLTHVVMDKTGTLTTGRLSVSELVGDLSMKHLILLCAAERQDALTHPVARAIFQWALLKLPHDEKHKQNACEVEDLISTPGKGVSCRARILASDEWTTVHVGTQEFLRADEIVVKNNISPSSKHTPSTQVHIAFNRKHVASLSLQDTVRSEASFVIDTLKIHFSLDLTLLTGDTEIEAERVSSELSIPVLASRTLPHEKAALIEDIQRQGNNMVAMLGDGINDTPAMSAADVGIFLSPGLLSHSSGSTGLQRGTADVIITTPSLTVLPELLVIAQKTVRQARLNTQWAILYNVVAVALAMGVAERWGITVDAAMAGTTMALSSCLVMVGCGLLRWELQSIEFQKPDMRMEKG